MVAALEGLAGIESVRTDLGNDRFTVGYDPDGVQPAQMLEAIEALDFEPEIVDTILVDTISVEPDRQSSGPPPSPVAEALAVAEREGKLLFLDFWAEWCAPCKVLEERTIADSRIQDFLNRHVFLRVDADAHPAAVDYYEAFGLPTIIVLSSQAEELFRHVGFIEAEKLFPELVNIE